ncbi:hypothetical protein MRB53_012725 [Persea americana]|uniref:Uncharacterized protein n=1 Tax=Persea americana TaxID=3435 RepID=A0ACC2LZ44_PERAE|nr:hypothetical protein MRB53_012725 [Persea americana]
MASSSSSLGTLHLSPSIMVFIHIESCDAFSFDAWRCSFIVRILDKASGTFMLRLTIRFRLVVAVFVMIGSCGAGLRKKSSFDVGEVDGSCSWGFSDEFCNGGRIRDDVGSWVLSVDSKDEADADAVGDDALGDDGGFLERPPQRAAMMAMVAAIHAIKRERESAGWWWVDGLASEGYLLPMVEINMNQDLYSLSLSRVIGRDWFEKLCLIGVEKRNQTGNDGKGSLPFFLLLYVVGLLLCNRMAEFKEWGVERPGLERQNVGDMQFSNRFFLLVVNCW